MSVDKYEGKKSIISFYLWQLPLKDKILKLKQEGKKKRVSPTYYIVYHFKMFKRHPEIVYLVWVNILKRFN